MTVARCSPAGCSCCTCSALIPTTCCRRDWWTAHPTRRTVRARDDYREVVNMSLRIAALVLAVLAPLAANADTNSSRPRIEDASVAQLQAAMTSGRLTSEGLTRAYIARILHLDQDGPGVNSVMELNADALAMARHADALRRHGRVLGPLHGIPVLLKGNIDTGDRMQTTAGSLGLKGAPA